MKSNLLHARALDTLPTGKRHHDGRGLYLDKISSQPRWVQRLTVAGKPTMRAIGAYPQISLAQARERSAMMREAPAPTATKPDSGVTFANVLDEVIARDNRDWRPATADQWQREMVRYAASLMDMPVAEITTRHIVDMLEAPTLPRTTAERLRRRVTVVMRRARGQGYRADNPCDDRLDDAMPKQARRCTHHKAVNFAEVPAAIRAIGASDEHAAVKLVIQFAILTAARNAEASGATWDEIDLLAGEWRIPAERMKAGKAHTVPLSSAAVDVLREAAKRWGQEPGTLVFKSRYQGKRVANLSAAITRCGIASTMHGFRSAFRTWAVEAGGAREAVAEAALAHAKASSIIASYERTTFLDARRGLMQQWADFVTRVS